MKNKYLLGVIIVPLVFAVFSGCKSEPPVQPEPVPESEPVLYQPDTLVPLTPSIIYRLGESYNKLPENIGKYQLVLKGKILLETEYTQANDKVSNTGRVKFEDIHHRDTITINDQTEGLGSTIDIFGSEIVISVCFEKDDKYRLNFATVSGDPEGYFYLKYNEGGSGTYSDEKGLIDYGGDTYRLRYSDDMKPYLMIMLTYQDTLRLNSRTVSGRSLGQ